MPYPNAAIKSARKGCRFSLVVAIMMKTTASRSRNKSHIEFILSSIKHLP
jgi:hypothetical protein